MGLFKKLESDVAITVSGYLERQVDLYERDGFLYVKYGSGYIKLYTRNGTSHPKVQVLEIHCSRVYSADRMGRLKIHGPQ